MFAQVPLPGRLWQSDFSHMNRLGATIAGERVDHRLNHFVLTYLDWEAATICVSESLDKLRVGLQNALWDLGATDRSAQPRSATAAAERSWR